MSLLLFVLLAAEPFPQPSDCHCWSGLMKGNDEVVTHIYLCREPSGEVAGWLDWNGKESGQNVRALKGQWQGASITLKDTRFLIRKPNPGWRFCKIDFYQLQLSKKTGVLGGEYVSKECRDKAKLTFQRAPLDKCLAAEIALTAK